MIHLLFILYYLYCWYFAGKWNIVSRTPYYGPTHLLTVLRPFLIDILCCFCMNKFPAFQTGEEWHIVLIYTMNIELRTLYPTSTVKTMSKVWCIVYLKTSPYYKYIYIYKYIFYIIARQNCVNNICVCCLTNNCFDQKFIANSPIGPNLDLWLCCIHLTDTETTYPGWSGCSQLGIPHPHSWLVSIF